MEYNLEEGLIKIDGRIWVGQNPGLQHKILTALHTSAVGGHSGVGHIVAHVLFFLGQV
jgi:hypothetical protein